MMSPYQSDRPDIPAHIEREIKVEAGHKCSVKGCTEHTYLEIHHINKNHEDNRKENLILLCDKHHKMAHNDVIDRKALHCYKEILRNGFNGNNFIRGQESDRVLKFLNTITETLSYNDDETISSIGSETGYWFEQEIYIKLTRFFEEIQAYNLELRSHDQSARDRQDRIVALMHQLLKIRADGSYRYNGGYCAKFIPSHRPGTPEYDSEIRSQIELVRSIALEIQSLAFELWDYVERRL